MKKVIILSLLGLTTSCSHVDYSKKEETTEALLHKSDSAIKKNEEAAHSLDSVVEVVLGETEKTFLSLDSQVNMYKEELQKATTIKTVVVHKTDTVYIETKKNFWGKEKVKTKILSDSTVEETSVTDTIQ